MAGFTHLEAVPKNDAAYFWCIRSPSHYWTVKIDILGPETHDFDANVGRGHLLQMYCGKPAALVLTPSREASKQLSVLVVTGDDPASAHTVKTYTACGQKPRLVIYVHLLTKTLNDRANQQVTGSMLRRSSL